MALEQRLGQSSSPTADDQIPGHMFMAAMTLQAAGDLTEVQVTTHLDLSPAELSDWQAIQTWMSTGGAAAQLFNRAVLESVVTALEDTVDGAATPSWATSVLTGHGVVF